MTVDEALERAARKREVTAHIGPSRDEEAMIVLADEVLRLQGEP
jgi:hypothetical protein